MKLSAPVQNFVNTWQSSSKRLAEFKIPKKIQDKGTKDPELRFKDSLINVRNALTGILGLINGGEELLSLDELANLAYINICQAKEKLQKINFEDNCMAAYNIVKEQLINISEYMSKGCKESIIVMSALKQARPWHQVKQAFASRLSSLTPDERKFNETRGDVISKFVNQFSATKLDSFLKSGLNELLNINTDDIRPNASDADLSFENQFWKDLGLAG